MAVILIRGTGDVGSAIAFRLFKAGHAVVLHDQPKPSHARRGMAFADALFSGRAELDGVLAKYAKAFRDLKKMIRCSRAIPVIDAEFDEVLSVVRPDVLVDARMRKHESPECQRGIAPLTVGLGPGFIAGETADLAVETAWGKHLGEIVRSGRTLDLYGEPQQIAGHGRDRFVYAPVAGTFRTTLEIGAKVSKGQKVAHIGDLPLAAPLTGRLRGLTHDGAYVSAGAKVIEVDPRDDSSDFRGLGERPAKIAQGVLKLVAD